MYYTGGDQLKIICDPFRPAEMGDDELIYHNCYDILHLGMPTKGYWQCALSFVGTDDDMEMKLEFSRRKSKLSKRIEDHVIKKFPLYFDNGTNSVQVGKRIGGIILAEDTTVFAAPKGGSSQASTPGEERSAGSPTEASEDAHQETPPYLSSVFAPRTGEQGSRRPSPVRRGAVARRGRGSLMGRPRIDPAEHRRGAPSRSPVQSGRAGNKRARGASSGRPGKARARIGGLRIGLGAAHPELESTIT